MGNGPLPRASAIESYIRFSGWTALSPQPVGELSVFQWSEGLVSLQTPPGEGEAGKSGRQDAAGRWLQKERPEKCLQLQASQPPVVPTRPWRPDSACACGLYKVPRRIFSRDVTRARVFGPLGWDAFPNSASLSSSCGFGEGD